LISKEFVSGQHDTTLRQQDAKYIVAAMSITTEFLLARDETVEGDFDGEARRRKIGVNEHAT